MQFHENEQSPTEALRRTCVNTAIECDTEGVRSKRNGRTNPAEALPPPNPAKTLPAVPFGAESLGLPTP
eukprot:15445011-Alexandrium_andersonii.AAC.1